MSGRFEFGAFCLDRARRMLLRDGAPVALAPKALELLEVLVDHRDRTLSKLELMERLWPETVVAENNLTVTMSALRKALGESAARPRYLQTLSRRGYRFVEAPLEASAASAGSPPPSSPARLVRSAGSANGGSPDDERTPLLVGRDAELAVLQERLEQAAAGRGRVVFVTGEPGIGKTALCDAFIASLVRRVPGVTLMRGRSLEQFGSREAYLPWLEAWGALLAGERGNDARTALRRFATSWCREFPAEFASSATQGAELAPAELSGQRLMREMVEALAALAAEGCLLIVLEDLHWADVASCDLLRLVCQRSAERRWLVVGTFRSVEAGLLNPPLESLRREALAHGECDELRLALLGREHVAAHLSQAFAPNDFPAEMAAALFHRTEGHPLFLTRLLSFLVERGDILLREGCWTLGCPLERQELDVPEDVRALLRRKLDALEPAAREALAHASVEGNEFSSRVLAELLGVDELEVEERLHPLWNVHRLIEVLGDEEWPDGQQSTRYRFAHVLYQQELYEGLLPRRRMLLHRRIADVLLTHSDAGRQRLAAALAVHLDRARDFARAVEYYALAAANAHRLCAYAEEARHCSRALQLCASLPEPERASHACGLYLSLGWALHHAGQSARAKATFLELLDYARGAARPWAECEALHCLCAVAWFAGEIDECRKLAQRGLETARARDQQRYELLALVNLTGATAGAGNFIEAHRLAHEALPRLEQLDDTQILACGFINLGWIATFQSEFAAAEAAYVRAGELWGSLGASLMSMDSANALGWIRAQRGQLSAGLRAFEEAADWARRHLHEAQHLRFADGTGWILRELGDVAAATSHDLAGLERARAQRSRFGELCYAIQLGADLAEAEDWAAADRYLAQAEELLRDGNFEVFPCHVRRAELRLRAAQSEYWLARGELQRADEEARRLLELSALDPSREHQVIARERLARVALVRGQLDVARVELDGSLALLDAYPMPLQAYRVKGLAALLGQRRNDAESSEQALSGARELVERIAASIDSAPLRASFLRSRVMQELGLGATSVPECTSPRAPK